MDWGKYADFFRKPALAQALWRFAFFAFSFSTFVSGFALFAERRYTHHGLPFGPKEVGYIYAYSGSSRNPHSRRVDRPSRQAMGRGKARHDRIFERLRRVCVSRRHVSRSGASGCGDFRFFWKRRASPRPHQSGLAEGWPQGTRNRSRPHPITQLPRADYLSGNRRISHRLEPAYSLGLVGGADRAIRVCHGIQNLSTIRSLKYRAI